MEFTQFIKHVTGIFLTLALLPFVTCCYNIPLVAVPQMTAVWVPCKRLESHS